MERHEPLQPLTPEEEKQLRRMARQLIDAVMKTSEITNDDPVDGEEADAEGTAQAV